MADKKNFYYKKSLTALEFDKVQDILSSFAVIDKTKEIIHSIIPLYDSGCVKRMQTETTQAKNMVTLNRRVPLGNLSDNIDLHIGKAVKGITLNIKDFIELAKLMRVSLDMSRYRADNNAQSDTLDAMFDRLYDNKELLERIEKTFPDEMHVADDASRELLSIRRAIARESQKIKDSLDKYIKNPEISACLQDQIVTIRYDRFVIPVKAENRNSIKGLVHDTSNTGSTLFIEPLFVIDANNNIRKLENDEKQEIERILKELTEQISVYSQLLLQSYKSLLSLDYIFAKARYSYELDMCEPVISDTAEIEIKNARHPLISKDAMVPLDISMDKSTDTVIVTGPNTGGKTVFLKTIGLMCAMAKCGMHLPCDRARIFVFDRVYADIGDEQSIEQSLSTFSSHLKNIKNILANTGYGCLVLFDELGSGTDPVEGAALAISVIQKVRSSGSFCACTTHYSELKTFALSEDGIKNASFEFDLETLRPTYRLNMGIPGKSYAFEISKHLGLQDDVIDNAKKLISGDVKNFDTVIDSLLREKGEYEHKKREIADMKSEIAEQKRKLDEKQAKLDKEIQKELDAAQVKARQAIEKARHDAMSMLEDLKKQKDAMDKASYQQIKSAIKGRLNKLDYEDITDKTSDYEGNPVKELTVGMEVYVRKIAKTGTVISIEGDSVRIKCQNLVISVKKDELYEAPSDKKENPKEKKSTSKLVRDASASVKTELDIRGETVADSLDAIDRFLDNALLDHLSTVTIIHGKGTGALRTGVHAYLKTHRQVKKFHLGSYGEGDSGVTIVELK